MTTQAIRRPKGLKEWALIFTLTAGLFSSLKMACDFASTTTHRGNNAFRGFVVKVAIDSLDVQRRH